MEKKFKLGPLKKREKKEKASGEKPSIKLARFIIEKQNWIVSVFIAACIFCAVAMLFVEVNYDLPSYLNRYLTVRYPEDIPSDRN